MLMRSLSFYHRMHTCKQNMMDAINDLKKKLESVSYTAAAAKGVHEADVKKKDGVCVCVCARARMVVYVCTHACVYMFLCLRVHVRVGTCVYACVCMCVCVCVCMCACVRACRYMCMCMCVCKSHQIGQSPSPPTSDELKNLRAEMEKREQQAKTAHEAELRKLQGDLTKAKGEVQAMKKQRDAKLAIHERQVRSCDCIRAHMQIRGRRCQLHDPTQPRATAHSHLLTFHILTCSCSRVHAGARGRAGPARIRPGTTQARKRGIARTGACTHNDRSFTHLRA